MKISFLSKHGLNSATSLLRVAHPLEYLNSLGHTASASMVYRRIPTRSDVVVMHRVVADAYTVRLIRYLKSVSSVVVYDCDDLLFDENGGTYLRRIGKKKCDRSRMFRQAMELCDVITVSTEYLKQKAEFFHPDVRVIRNALSQLYLERASRVFNEKRLKCPGDQVVIGYLSGSLSHDENFKRIEEQLLRLMTERLNVKLLIVGYLNHSEDFDTFEERFEKREFISYEKFADVFREIDINLVPLNTEEPFCHGKSELKYIEAGACGVPSICSPTDTYQRIIDHGVTGFIADDDEWYYLLSDLVDNADKRHSVGEAARKHVENEYAPPVRTREWQAFIEEQGGLYSRTNNNSSSVYVFFDWVRLLAYVQVRKFRRVAKVFSG